MAKLCDPDKCTGCGACANICPVQCIAMKTGRGGYLLPKIQKERCIECGRCARTCPELNPVDLHSPVQVLAACGKQDEERAKGASGGIAGVF